VEIFSFGRPLSRTSTLVGQGTLPSPTTGCRIRFPESLLMLGMSNTHQSLVVKCCAGSAIGVERPSAAYRQMPPLPFLNPQPTKSVIVHPAAAYLRREFHRSLVGRVKKKESNYEQKREIIGVHQKGNSRQEDIFEPDSRRTPGSAKYRPACDTARCGGCSFGGHARGNACKTNIPSTCSGRFVVRLSTRH
jgi:hypothetical protein